MMKRALFLAGLFLLAAAEGGAQDYARIFLAADSAVFPVKARMDMRMVNFSNGRDTDTFEFTCFLNGQDKYLLIFQKPAPVKGDLQLRVGGIIYQYSKRVNKTSKTSAESMFLNSLFTQEDIMNSTLSSLYAVTGGEETSLDGKPCHLITLAPRKGSTTYKSIRAYVDASSGLLMKREYYSHTDELIKVLIVDSMESSNGVATRVACTVNSALQAGAGTRVVFDAIDAGYAMSELLFDPKRLQYIN
jgi:outer membrane lipoprotein-sorting protein